MHTLLGVVLIAHGLITVAISAGSFAPSTRIPNPAWLNWWAPELGQSWLLPRIGWVGGLLWLVAGLLLLGAGLAFFGFLLPNAWWPPAAIAGAGIALVTLVIFFHPYYVLAVGLNLYILYLGLRPDAAP